MSTSGSREREKHESMSRAGRVSPGDLASFLPYACRELQLEFSVQVHTRSQQEYVPQVYKPRSKINRTSMIAARAPSAPATHDADSDDNAAAAALDGDLVNVPVTVTLNATGRVLELDMTCVRVPRALIKVVALAAPYNPLFERLALRRCRLRGDIVHELAKPAFAALTDVCLDGSALPEGNYTTLLDCGWLRRLSLARVRLDDTECAELAARLQHPLPGSCSLRLLDLGSNAVGDAGAVALAKALRTNRTLLHLNLAGNRIGDDGAAELLRVLNPFPLTGHELLESRRRRLVHVRSVRAATAALLKEAAAASTPRTVEDPKRGQRGPPPTSGRGTAWRRTSGAHSIPDDERLNMRAIALVGSLADPFPPSETVSMAGHPYCSGNRVLCYLNLAYNRGITVVTADRLAQTLEVQRVTRRSSLLRVVLEGNPLPTPNDSAHMAHVEELLERAVASAVERATDLYQRRSLRSRTIR